MSGGGYRLGFIGAGTWLQKFLPYLDRDEIELDRVFDIKPYDDLGPEIGRDTYQRRDPDHVYGEEDLAGLDAVYIANHVNNHREQAIAAIDNMPPGSAVFTEKAHGPRLEDHLAVKEAAEDSDVMVSNSLHYIYKKPSRTIPGLMDWASELGDIEHVEASFLEEATQEDAERTWPLKPENGGIFLDWIHPQEVMVEKLDARFTGIDEARGVITQPGYSDRYPTAGFARYSVEGPYFADDATATIGVGKGFQDTVKQMRIGFPDFEVEFDYTGSDTEMRTDERGRVTVRDREGNSVSSTLEGGPTAQELVIEKIVDVLEGGEPDLDTATMEEIMWPVEMANQEIGMFDEDGPEVLDRYQPPAAAH